MAKLTFNDLSPEIKKSIVIRPSELKNLCLVNKQLHGIAVIPLYRNVALDLGSSKDTKLAAFLSPRNIGLKHIKQIRLYLAGVRDRCGQDQQAHLMTRMILEFLPQDVLEEFSWCPWRPFSADNLLLLYKKQRKMKWLEVMDLDREVLPDLKKDQAGHKGIFQHARKLALYPENRETLKLSGYFVRNTTNLDELIIHANFHDHHTLTETVESRELNDNATQPGLLTRTIFSHLFPFDRCQPFAALQSLRLHEISLRYCADTWCRIVDFSRIQHLRLYNCTGADTLFGQLSRSSHLPRRLKVLEFQHKDNSENEALLALDGFLCLVSGLKDLIIDLEHVKYMPAAAGIIRHSKTLELLNVHCSLDSNSNSIVPTVPADDISSEELLWDPEDFASICAACTNLEQLSCAWPATSLLRSPTEDWKAYERAATSLLHLVTLHISTWPSDKPSSQLLPRHVYETLLQGHAQRLFDSADFNAAMPQDSTVRPASISPIRLIAFGISDKIYEREDSRNQILYLRSRSFDAENLPQTHAAKIGWNVRKFIEPRSEVLDFVLHREARPPVREARGGGDMGRGIGEDHMAPPGGGMGMGGVGSWGLAVEEED